MRKDTGVPDSSQSKSKLTSHGVEEAPSSHSHDHPRPWEHPSHRPCGWCSFGRDRLMLDFRQGQLLEAQRCALCFPSPTAHLYEACGLDRLLVTKNIFLQVSMLRHGPRMDIRDQRESPRPGSQQGRNSYPRVDEYPSLRYILQIVSEDLSCYVAGSCASLGLEI